MGNIAAPQKQMAPDVARDVIRPQLTRVIFTDIFDCVPGLPTERRCATRF
jgi:hypothetical protein